MIIDYKRTGRCFRFRHMFFNVLAEMAVLLSISGCAVSRHDSGADISTAARFGILDESTMQEQSAPSGEDFEDVMPSYDGNNYPYEDIPYEDISYAEQLNRDMAAAINEEYGVNIVYGSDAVWQYGAAGNGITDEELIAKRLALLEECLGYYPKELFYDLTAQSPITINLIDSLNGADGYTDGSNPQSIQIALSCDNSAAYFKLAFHHEFFHFMEYYMLYSSAHDELPLYHTADCNDASLYGTTDYSGTIYDTEAGVYGQYFTSIYAKTNDMEDRAEVFSYYMGSTSKECMKVSDSPVSEKMKIIADSIRMCCPSLSVYPEGTLPWEAKIAY